ncbi:MAG TPA: phage holin family protein [Thermoleophilia bacterium]|nr:phage holin family protein [Thermoleophilia bacterium]
MTDDATPRSSTARTTVPAAAGTGYGETPRWRPGRPKLNAVRLLLQWAVSAAALAIAALIVPGVAVQGAAGALLAAGLIALLNAFLPPLIAALRLPFMLVVGFILVLLADAWMVMLAADLSERTFTVASFGSAVLVALVAAAVSIALQVVLGLNDDDTYSVRVSQRAAARSHDRVVTDVPGVVYLEIDGLARPVLQRAMRGGHAPNLARWVASGSHRLAEWETDLSSQTGASQAGLLLGSNDDIPAFRWVEKESGTVMTCSAPSDCEEIERRHSGERGLLADGGASRSNLLSGGADEVILTVSRMAAEKEANPGYRAFLANGYNVTRTLVLFVYELVLEWVAAARSARRDIQPRGHRPLEYGFVRAGLGVFVRDLTVYSIIDDMMKGRPAIYACFAGYDEVAHHSGLERVDAMEVLRKIDQQFERISRARAYAARPYEIVVLSDHGQTQGATFLQRNGYGLDELVQRSVEQREVAPLSAGDENDSALGQAVREATGRQQQKPGKKDVSGQDVVVLGSGNLGLVYLMEEPRRLTLEEIDRRHPRLLPTLRAHPHIGWLLVRSEKHGPVALGSRGVRYLSTGAVEGDDPLAAFPPSAAQHLLRTDGFPHVADIMVNSFYDEQLDEGCAFEELISFHGGMGGSQTRPFLLHPSHLPLPATPLVGAEQVHEVLAGWRRSLQDGDPEGAETSSEQTAPRSSPPDPITTRSQE